MMGHADHISCLCCKVEQLGVSETGLYVQVQWYASWSYLLKKRCLSDALKRFGGNEKTTLQLQQHKNHPKISQFFNMVLFWKVVCSINFPIVNPPKNAYIFLLRWFLFWIEARTCGSTCRSLWRDGHVWQTTRVQDQAKETVKTGAAPTNRCVFGKGALQETHQRKIHIKSHCDELWGYIFLMLGSKQQKTCRFSIFFGRWYELWNKWNALGSFQRNLPPASQWTEVRCCWWRNWTMSLKFRVDDV